MTKRCNTCLTERESDQFYKCSSSKDGLQSKCKACESERTKYRLIHERAYQLNRMAEYRKSHKERLIELTKIWRQNNLEHRKKYDKDYRLKHKQQYKNYRHNRKIRKKNAPGAHYTTSKHIEWKRDMWGGLCYECGNIADTIDHVIPLTLGGAHFPSNLRPMCMNCNRVKNNKWPSFLPNRRIPISASR